MSNRPSNGKASAANVDRWIIDLPTELRDNHARLRATAANLLERAHVRSVIIESNHSRAVVRLHPNRPIASDLGCIPTLAASELLSVHQVASSTSTSIVSWIDPRDQSLCFIKLPARARGWRRGMLLVAAAGALLLGLLGVLLPGLPTTPFVLVASYCLLRSSPRLHAKLLENRLFGNVLRDWHLHRGIRPHVRYKATAVIVLVVGASLALTSLPLLAKLIILAVAVVGIAYVWRLPDASAPVSSEVI